MTKFDTLFKQIINEHLLIENSNPAIVQFASKAHEEWRKNFDPTGKKERIKKNSDGTEGNINVPFEKLHPDWQKENLAAGKAAFDAVNKFKEDEEAAAKYIHDEWMRRNPKGEWNAAQHVPYEDLSETEKEKDRVHVRTMAALTGQKPIKESVSSTNLPSELFDSSYCIFVSADKASEFKKAIQEHGFDKEGVRILSANFNDSTAVIVIPIKSNFRDIEKVLCDLPASKDGFWGQAGMGYKGKSWSVI